VLSGFHVENLIWFDGKVPRREGKITPCLTLRRNLGIDTKLLYTSLTPIGNKSTLIMGVGLFGAL
jgi:hypothetical protein